MVKVEKGKRHGRDNWSKVVVALVTLLGLLGLWFQMAPPVPSLGNEGPQSTMKLHDGYQDPSREILLANADRKIAERRAWLNPKHEQGTKFGSLRSDKFFYMFPPVLPCFWTFEKFPDSIQMHDGPKWTCGLQEVHQFRSDPAVNYSKAIVGTQKHYERPCIVYSMGSRGKFEFEERIRAVAPGCEIHIFDPTYNPNGRGQDVYDAYHSEYGFGGKDSTEGKFPVKSLQTIMKELKHTHVDYLKVDVEGYEWDFFTEVDWSAVKIGQLLIELHPQMGRSDVIMTAVDMDKVFVKLEEAGFRLISLEPVSFGNLGQVELVFMHKTWQPSGVW